MAWLSDHEVRAWELLRRTYERDLAEGREGVVSVRDPLFRLRLMFPALGKCSRPECRSLPAHAARH